MDEHRAVLGEITDIAHEEQVDLVLVAGDQFDRPVPSPESEMVVYRTLLDLAGTGAHVVVIAGNHDNPRRLAAVSPLLKRAGVTAGSVVVPPDRGGVFRHTTPSGEHACIALFPFQSQRGIVTATALMSDDPDDHQKSYSQRCRRITDALCSEFGADTVNLVVAHLTVMGAAEGGGERKAHIFDYYLPSDIFPEPAHYVALGHIHKPQRVAGRCPIHYAGSPLALDFGETHGKQSVRIIDVSPVTPARVREVPLKAGCGLRTLRGRAHELMNHAGTTGEDFLRLIVEERASPGLAEGLREAFPRAVDVIVAGGDRETSRVRPVDPGALRGDPGAVFRQYLEEQDIEGDELTSLFDELLDDELTQGHGTDAPAAT